MSTLPSGTWSINSVASPTRPRSRSGSNERGPPGSLSPRSVSRGPEAVVLGERLIARPTRRCRAQRGSISRPSARRGVRQMAAPSSVPPTPANGSSTTSSPLVKNSMSRGHQPRWLVGTVRLACGVAQLGGIGGREQRLGEVEPFITAQFIERIVRMDGSVLVGQRCRSRSEVCPTRRLCSQAWRSWAGSASWLSWPKPCAVSQRGGTVVSC